MGVSVGLRCRTAALDEIGRGAGQAIHLGDWGVFRQVGGDQAVFGVVVAGVCAGCCGFLQLPQAPLVEISGGFVGSVVPSGIQLGGWCLLG
jgi:hypothetical protein